MHKLRSFKFYITGPWF